jgi:hypothetical protein
MLITYRSSESARLFDIAIRYLIPIALAVLLVSDLAADVRTPYGRYSWIMVLLIGPGWLVATFLLAIFIAGRGSREIGRS